jgi:hypothetical protein
MANNQIMLADNSISPQLMKEEGSMKAYQSVAQSSALAVQDAVDNLRNINTISTTALGVAMAQMLADPPLASQYDHVVTSAQNISTAAAANFLTIGQNAATVMNAFAS